MNLNVLVLPISMLYLPLLNIYKQTKNVKMCGLEFFGMPKINNDEESGFFFKWIFIVN